MPRPSLRISDRYRQPVEDGLKTIEIRPHVAANVKLIREMAGYGALQFITLEFFPSSTKLTAVVTKRTKAKRLGDVTDPEIQAIAGRLDATRADLMAALRHHYPRERIDDETMASLAHFKRLQGR